LQIPEIIKKLKGKKKKSERKLAAATAVGQALAGLSASLSNLQEAR